MLLLLVVGFARRRAPGGAGGPAHQGARDAKGRARAPRGAEEVFGGAGSDWNLKY